MELLDRLASNGVELWFEGERLRFRATAGALTPELRAELSTHRTAVVAQLRANAAAVTRDFPLSYSQRSLWFVNRENPASAAYNVAFQARVVSTVNVPALRQALQALLDRHAALRTTYPIVDGVPLQRVAGAAPVAFAVRDVAGRDDDAVREIVRAEYRAPFDLAVGPVFRATLFSRAQTDHVFLLTAHHIAADGWSLLQLLEELRALYAEATGAVAPPLPRSEVQYTDFTSWQAGTLASEEGKRLEEYWQRQLRASPANLELPPDHPRPRHASANGSSFAFQLDDALSTSLRQMARREGTTPFVVLLAAFNVFLFRHTATEDVVVGTPTFGRNRPEFARVVGDFVNTIPLRSRLDGSLPFRELLAGVRQTLLDALAAQDFPFPLIVEKVQPSRRPGQSPLFDVLFLLQRFDTVKALESVMAHRPGAPPVDFGGLQLEYFPLEQQLGQFDLTLEMVDGIGALTGHFKYNADLFDRTTIERMSSRFRMLLEGIVADASQSIGALPMLPPAESEWVLRTANATTRDFPADTALTRLIEAQVARAPERIAISHGGTTLTYGELNARANALARHLESFGVGPGVSVALCVPRGLDLPVTLLGIQKAGGTYVPLDPSFPADRLEYMVTDSGAAVLITADGAAANIAIPAGVHSVDLRADDATLRAFDRGNLATSAGAGDVAYILYTSGSTGRPKGVAVTQRALVNFLCSMRREPGLSSTDVLAAVTTISFDIAGLELYLPLITGARIELVGRDDAMSGEALAERLARSGATVMQATPATWQMLVRAGWRGIPGFRALCGGDALTRELADALLGRVTELWNLYGPTETTIWSSVGRVQSDGAISIGRPIANTHIYIVDPLGNPAPVGVTGEIWIGGRGVAAGYHRRPDLTAERFLPDPFGHSSDSVYRSGDLGRWQPNGTLQHFGRLDHQVKIRGFRVELGEIEAIVSRCAGVRQCVATVREDVPGDKRLVAYLIVDGEREATLAGVRSALVAALPEYMRPSAFAFVDAFPLTPNGKVDRRALPRPDADRYTAAQFVAPRTETEKRLATIWQDVLRIERVGAQDSFFELGGHSLRAMEVVFRIQELWGATLPLVEFLRDPTIAAVAALLEKNGAVDAGASVIPAQGETGTEIFSLLEARPSDRFEPFPLTDVQEAYWIGRGGGFEMGNVATHVYAEIEIDGLDIDRYQRAWQRLVERHDMLRAIVRPDGQQQVLEHTPPFVVARQDLRGRSAVEVETALAATRAELSHQVLPSDQWPLFEIRASRLGESGYRLHVSFDMLISDAWSFAVLQRDFDRFYADPDGELPPIGISFRDYVLATVRFRETDDYRRSLAYWDARSPSLFARPDLPLAKDPSSIALPRFTRHREHLSRDEWAALQRKTEAHGLTQNGVILAAYVDVLATWSRRSQFLLNLTLFNRLPVHRQVNDVVGDFTSITLLDVDVVAGDTFIELSKKLLSRLWDDLDHRFVSGVQVLRRLAREQPERINSAAPVVLTSTIGFDGTPAEGRDLAQRSELKYSITQTSQVWLDQMVSVDDGQLVFNWDVVEELFPAGMVGDMFASYVGHLKRLASEDGAWHDTRVQRARRLVPDTQLRQRAIVNATTATVRDTLLHVLFEEQAAAHPEQIAIVSGDVRITYAQLVRLSRRLGTTLREGGVRPNTLVAIVMEKGWEQAVAALAILQSGAAYVPIDANLPEERRLQLIENTEAAFVLTQPGLVGTLTWPDGVRVLPVERPEANIDDVAPLRSVQRSEDLAYVIYTSGSTGLPKGVMIDHRGAVNTIIDLNARFNVGRDDRVLALSSLSFDLSVYDIFGFLAAGGTMVIPEPGSTRDPARWAELIEREKITIWNSVPALMEMFVEYRTGRSEPLPPSLRLIMMSGDWIPITLPAQIRALSSTVQIMSLGGATEASIWSILYPIDQIDPAWKSVPYGRPMVNQTFHVLDEMMEPCPVWVPGQLYIGGIGVAKGYWHDEEKTNAKFVIHPRSGERLYSTGDLGRYLPSGDIEFLGREDFQVKIRGFRIELGEIEAAFRLHPMVRSAIVTAVGKTTAERRLVAYVVPQQEETDRAATESIDHAQLEKAMLDFLASKLPEHMIPSRVIALDHLPLTPNGKVDLRSLPEPDAASAAAGTEHAEPRNETEAVLVGVWREVLRAETVGIHDNFFDLGGDSVNAIQVVSRLARKGFELSPVMMFRHPTIAELGAKLGTMRVAAQRSEEITL